MDRFRGPVRQLRSIALYIALCALLVVTLASVIAPLASASQERESATGPIVVVVPVKSTVEQGLYSFMERAFNEARELRADHIIMVVNTLGGRVDSAADIGELVRTSPIPTTAFVESKAVSAGTYIALNAGNIVMQPGSTMGAAAVVNGSGDLIDNPKTVSYWVGQMREAALLNDRDPAIAEAMVDVNATVSLQEQIGRNKAQGEILSLSASEAEKVGYSDHTAASVDEVMQWLGLAEHGIVEVNPTIAENVARFLVNPVVSTLLLIAGIAGIAIELFVPGFGAPGIIGLSAFGLFFFGSFVSGFAGMEAVVLFVIGIVLLVIELFVPSFGIIGILGGAALVTGVIIAAPSPSSGFMSLLIALVAATIIVVIFSRTKKGRGVWNKFILRDNLTTEEGYLPADVRTSLLGQEGVALTPLRPAGTALIGEERVDVVTSGEYITSGKPVIVVKAEGTWIVVREAMPKQ